jgi:RecA-family ATPase
MSTTTRQNKTLSPLPSVAVAGVASADGVAGSSVTDALDAYASDFPPIVNAATWAKTEPPPHDPILTDVFDAGDKVCIIAGSKMRKSFFALDMMIHLAAGESFLNWTVVRALTVLIVQPEIRDHHYHRRFRRVWEAADRPEIGNRLHIMNARGFEVSIDSVTAQAEQIGAEVVLFDPLYKFTSGDENASCDMKPVLAQFDRLAQSTGAAVLYVHHDPKGDASERDIRDRGAGSNVLGRDYDACITLTAHRDNPDTAVIGTLLRNYPPQEQFCATWTNGRFLYDYNAAPVTGRAGKYDAAFRKFISEHSRASLSEIADAIGCDKSTASRLKKRLGVA